MGKDWLSVDDVAEQLDLHVRTIRSYIRDGKLPATRIGKQYRIRPADLDAFTGRPPTPVTVEVSAVAEIAGLPAAAADRLGTLLIAAAQGQGIHVRAIHDPDRGQLKIILLGPPGVTADALRLIDETVPLLTEQGEDTTHA